jgi:hypothetical protein
MNKGLAARRAPFLRLVRQDRPSDVGKRMIA